MLLNDEYKRLLVLFDDEDDSGMDSDVDTDGEEVDGEDIDPETGLPRVKPEGGEDMDGEDEMDEDSDESSDSAE